MTSRGVALTVLVLALAAGACTRPDGSTEIYDPYEASNRAAHEVNRSIDRAVFGQGGDGGAVPQIPGAFAIGFSNFIANLGQPRTVLNSLLQAKPGPALQNTLRFAVNTTVGIGGIFDPATAIGIPADDADFGETLHVWGVGEGAYLELPLYGPTTERDIVGTFVDLVIDPMNAVLDLDGIVALNVGRVAASATNRQRFADTYESILYESADSYAQARLLYLQNRHFELGIEEETFDPYEDPYAE